MKSLAIFDLDGTLIHSAPDLADALNATFTQAGYAGIDEADATLWLGGGSHNLIKLAGTAQGIQRPDELETLHAKFLEAYEARIIGRTHLYTGVREGLLRLQKAGVRLALVTNKPSRYLPDILTHFKLDCFFECVLGGDSLPTKKPDPAPLLHVCETLDVPTQEAVMVGDSKNDICAGQNAKMDTFALSWGYNYGKSVTEYTPTHTFDTFAPLVQAILEA